MANLGQKDGVYHVRFRLGGKEYKRSLKVRDRHEAATARNLVQVTLHRLRTGQLQIPNLVDVGDFVVSGGTLTTPPVPQEPVLEVAAPLPCPSTRQLAKQYAAS